MAETEKDHYRPPHSSQALRWMDWYRSTRGLAPHLHWWQYAADATVLRWSQRVWRKS